MLWSKTRDLLVSHNDNNMYKILAATRVDMNEGWVWISDRNFQPRSVIKITYKKNNKSIYCEALKIDENFIKEYNQPPRYNINANENTIVMNDWYRKRLGGIKTKQKYDLEISVKNTWWGKLRASTGHPQIVVRHAIWFAFIGLVLGVLSMFMTLI